MVREEPPAVPWIVERLVVRGGVTVLAGKPGEGKSLLSETLTAGVARGEVAAGMRCIKGRAMIVDGENGQQEIHRRVHALQFPDEGVSIYESIGPLLQSLSELDWELTQHKPDLLVLDSFRSLWHGEENDSGEVAEVLDSVRTLAREHQVGVLLLHHTGKSGNGYRGSSAIGASAELGFTLARDEADPDPLRRCIECWKCRPAPEPPKRWLALSAEGDRVLVSDAASPDSGRPGIVRSEIVRRVLSALRDNPMRLSEIARVVGRKPSDQTVRRALAELEKAGSVVRQIDGSWELSGGLVTPNCQIVAAPLGATGDNDNESGE